MRILLVEEITSIGASLVGDEGNCVIHADTHAKALSFLEDEQFDIVIVNVPALPAGEAFILDVRAVKDKIPLVALTRPNRIDNIRALNAGADDAISQPVDPVELHARIVAVVRRRRGHSQSLIQVGALSLSLQSRSVWFDGIPLHLTGKEYLVLEMLVLRVGHTVNREMMAFHLYGSASEREKRRLDLFVFSLRRKLSNSGVDDLIGTVQRRGYTIRETDQKFLQIPDQIETMRCDQSLHLDNKVHLPAARPALAKRASVKEALPKVVIAPKTPAPTSVVTLKTVFEQLGQTHYLPKELSQTLMTDLVVALTTHLRDGTRIRIKGLGTLHVRNRVARIGRNPVTGEEVQIKASKKVAFRPAKELKDVI